MVLRSSISLFPALGTDGVRLFAAGGDRPRDEAGLSDKVVGLKGEALDIDELGGLIGSSSWTSEIGGDTTSGSTLSAGESWPSLALCWLSPPADPSRSFIPSRVGRICEGALEREEDVVLEGLAVPFMFPVIEGREDLEGGAIDVRGPLVGGSIDFLAVVDGVLARVELFDDVLEPSCLVGDLLGDFK